MDISYILVLFQFLLYITIYCCSVSVPGIFVMFQCLLYICMYVYTIHILLSCFSAGYTYSTVYIYRYLYCCYALVPVIHTVYMYLYFCYVSVPVIHMYVCINYTYIVVLFQCRLYIQYCIYIIYILLRLGWLVVN